LRKAREKLKKRKEKRKKRRSKAQPSKPKRKERGLCDAVGGMRYNPVGFSVRMNH